MALTRDLWLLWFIIFCQVDRHPHASVSLLAPGMNYWSLKLQLQQTSLMHVNMSSYVMSTKRVFLVCRTCYHVQIGVSAKTRVRRKLFLSYLVHFQCVQIILENFLMSAGSSNHSAFYHESNGPVFKIKYWFRRKGANPFHIKKCCIYQLACPWSTINMCMCTKN